MQRQVQEEVDYLGHTLDAQGVLTSTQKVKAILEAHQKPTDSPQLSLKCKV